MFQNICMPGRMPMNTLTYRYPHDVDTLGYALTVIRSRLLETMQKSECFWSFADVRCTSRVRNREASGFRQRIASFVEVASGLFFSQDAIKLDSMNPLARFERAALLEGAGRLAEALQELAMLRDMLPRDASVYFKTGRVRPPLPHISIHICQS